MVTLTLITVGTLKEDYLRAAVKEYEKRLGAFCRVENVNLREERITDEDDKSKIAAALHAEGDKILAALPRNAYRIALCIEGEMPTSPALAEYIGKAVDRHGSIALVIGSSYGLDERVKADCHLRLSLSRLTFPHQLARVILLEALYRAFSIQAGKRYHK